MIFLFNRVYVKHDNTFAHDRSGKLIVITARQPEIPYIKEPEFLLKNGIYGIYKDLNAIDLEFGSRINFWNSLINDTSKINIIASPVVVAEMLIQYWKSIFKTPAVKSLYTLYQLTVNNENLHNQCENERRIRRLNPTENIAHIEKISEKAFIALFDNVEVIPELAVLPLEAIPFEFLMIAYLSGNIEIAQKKVLFEKIERIIHESIAADITSLRDDLFCQTYNFYLLNDDGEEELIIDPLQYIKSHPKLSWALDDVFEYGREDDIIIKYPLAKLCDILKAHRRLIHWREDDMKQVDYLISRQFDELIDFDVNDHQGNYFSMTAYLTKLNGLLISYAYQLKRLGMTESLEAYKLK